MKEVAAWHARTVCARTPWPRRSLPHRRGLARCALPLPQPPDAWPLRVRRRLMPHGTYSTGQASAATPTARSATDVRASTARSTRTGRRRRRVACSTVHAHAHARGTDLYSPCRAVLCYHSGPGVLLVTILTYCARPRVIFVRDSHLGLGGGPQTSLDFLKTQPEQLEAPSSQKHPYCALNLGLKSQLVLASVNSAHK